MAQTLSLARVAARWTPLLLLALLAVSPEAAQVRASGCRWLQVDGGSSGPCLPTCSSLPDLAQGLRLGQGAVLLQVG